MKVQQEISLELNQQKINKVFKTIIDRKEGEYFIGRTEFDSADVDNEVLIKADDNTYLSIGSFVDVKINEATDFDLYGILT